MGNEKLPDFVPIHSHHCAVHTAMKIGGAQPVLIAVELMSSMQEAASPFLSPLMHCAAEHGIAEEVG